VAGPGFGKSVLLAQATAENALAPRGVDLVVRCTEADGAPAHFLHRVVDALAAANAGGISSIGTTSPEELIAELGRRWPLGVCLVVDDAHHVVASVDGARVLARLVASAPASVHFMLAGRARLRGLGDARAAGQVLDIDERALSISTEEAAELARLHDVDPSVVVAAGGWPAAASVASAYGVDGATEYIWEAVLDHLDARERRVLAIAAAVGQADRALLQDAVGDDELDPESVLDRVPLVTRTDRREFVVHELWRRVVGAESTDADVRAAVGRAVDALVERQEYDRAFGLCVGHADWDRAGTVLAACCRRGHAEVRPDVLAGWLEALPRDRWETADGLLLRGLVARVNDPFATETAELLDRASAQHRAAGNVIGEVAAGNELAYVLRNQGRLDALPALLARAAELHAAGCRAVDGPMAMGRALIAELAGDDERMVAELDTIPAGSLSRDWQAVVAFSQTMGHLTLGNATAMLDAARRCVELAGDTTARHAGALAQWFAGDPRPALDACDVIAADAGRSRVDGVALGAFATMVLATAGRLDEASACLARTERAGTGPVSALMRGYMIGVRALVAAAHGDDDSARHTLESALAHEPLSGVMGWRRASRWLALAYVLVPAVRDDIDARDLGTVHQRRLAVARAVIAAIEGCSVPRETVAELRAAVVATTVPLPWAMALCSRLTVDGVALGREIAEVLLDLYGEPARASLRQVAGSSDRRLSCGARRLLAAITAVPHHVVELDVLGPTMLRLSGSERTDLDWQRERVRSLLLFLVVHGPARREQVMEALWPDLSADAADRNLRVTLTYLHRVLEPARSKGEAPFFVRQSGAALSLCPPPHLRIDAHEFEALLDRADDADDRGLASVALELLDAALALWRGPCLVDVAYEEWAQAPRRAWTERFVRAAVRAGELHVAAGRTGLARRNARRALEADEWSEAAHRVLIAAALADGDRAGAVRAMSECDAMLADLGVEAAPATDMLRRRLHVATPVRHAATA
jgi:LuxR family maltose regulon positive regulatory protein